MEHTGNADLLAGWIARYVLDNHAGLQPDQMSMGAEQLAENPAWRV